MKPNHKNDRDAVWRSLCADLHEDDGRRVTRSGKTNTPTNHKDLQLCAQVARAANLAFASANDSALHAICVNTCQTIASTKRLRITVRHHEPSLAPPDLAHRVQHATTYIRAEIASAIHRKRVPPIELVLSTQTDPKGKQP